MRLGQVRVRRSQAPPVPEGVGRRTAIPDGKPIQDFQIDRMVEYVTFYRGDPNIVRIARAVVLDCKPKDKFCEAGKIYDALLNTTRFVADPTDLEVLQTPLAMLRDIQEKGKASGDCDELAPLMATMLSAIGHRPRFVFGSDLPGGWQHVWVQDRTAGRFVDLDLAERLPIGGRAQFVRYGVIEIW